MRTVEEHMRTVEFFEVPDEMAHHSFTSNITHALMVHS